MNFSQINKFDSEAFAELAEATKIALAKDTSDQDKADAISKLKRF